MRVNHTTHMLLVGCLYQTPHKVIHHTRLITAILKLFNHIAYNIANILYMSCGNKSYTVVMVDQLNITCDYQKYIICNGRAPIPSMFSLLVVSSILFGIGKVVLTLRWVGKERWYVHSFLSVSLHATYTYIASMPLIHTLPPCHLYIHCHKLNTCTIHFSHSLHTHTVHTYLCFPTPISTFPKVTQCQSWYSLCVHCLVELLFMQCIYVCTLFLLLCVYYFFTEKTGYFDIPHQ